MERSNWPARKRPIGWLEWFYASNCGNGFTINKWWLRWVKRVKLEDRRNTYFDFSSQMDNHRWIISQNQRWNKPFQLQIITGVYWTLIQIFHFFHLHHFSASVCFYHEMLLRTGIYLTALWAARACSKNWFEQKLSSCSKIIARKFFEVEQVVFYCSGNDRVVLSL